MTNIEGLLLEANAGRCVGIQIANNTRDVTLENPRTYCFSGHAMIDPVSRIPPGSFGSSVFVKTSYTARGSVGVLSYESNTFTLAIMFSNPFDRVLYSSEFAIQIFTGRKHFHSMERLYHYMYSDGPPYTCESYRKVKLEVPNGQLEVTNKKIQVKATMSNKDKSIIKVQIEQKDPHTPSPSAPGRWPGVAWRGMAWRGVACTPRPPSLPAPASWPQKGTAGRRGSGGGAREGPCQAVWGGTAPHDCPDKMCVASNIVCKVIRFHCMVLVRNIPNLGSGQKNLHLKKKELGISIHTVFLSPEPQLEILLREGKGQ
ncbi:uncharacterized protein LOC128826691 [Malaclemys terrapin pileata]|uniref:uncharacterized protein LOC128826691 n=1 Tax=Malaclemys terrapin pileata TaxID=2991368 RepID=UPI0023A799DA|nr:uncharacterized protein LOC128826691 [Malaclemys terrapin pileata]